MTRQEMIDAVDQELQRLERIRELLKQSHSERFTLPEEAAAAKVQPRQRVLTPEARRRIGQAQERRWAKHKRETAGVPDA